MSQQMIVTEKEIIDNNGDNNNSLYSLSEDAMFTGF